MANRPILPFLILPVISVIILGGIGFACGFFGPIYLNHSANQGPLLGIFFTGPLGVVLGLMLGLLLAAFNIRILLIIAILFGAAAFTAFSTLYLSLPEDLYQGFIIDAEIRNCQPPGSFVTGAMEKWDKLYVGKTWNTPRPDWKYDVNRMLQTDHGVVLTLLVHRSRDIYEGRKPWNRYRLKATAWKSKETIENYFIRDDSFSCINYEIGHRAVYSPDWEPSQVSPSDILPSFLGMFTLKVVPENFRPFAK